MHPLQSHSDPAAPREAVGAQPAAGGPLRGRAVLLGAACCLGIAIGAPYSTHVLAGSYMDLDFSAPAAVFVLFLFAALLRPLLRRLAGRELLTRADVAVVYIMCLMACAVTTMGMASQLVPTIAAARYYGATTASWRTHALPWIRPWMLPGAHASERLFTGLRPGESIPWADWVTPLLAWAVLLGAFYTGSVCLMAILRRRWVDEERLAFPLTQLPLEITRPADSGGASLLRSGAMWVGFTVAAGLGTMRGLHHYWPSFPDFQQVWYLQSFRNSLLVPLRISLPMLGFFFLANPEAVLTMWLFNRLFWLAQGWMNITGVKLAADLGPYSASPVFGHFALGGFLAVAAATLGAAGPHIRGAWRTALRRPGGTDDSAEPMRYRMAFGGLAASGLVMAGWLRMAGLPLWAIPLFLAAVLVVFLTLTRVVAEVGMAEALPPVAPAGLVQAVTGTRIFGEQGMAALSMTYIWAGDIRTTVMTSAAHGFRLSDAVGARRTLLPAAMLGAVAISGVAAVVTTLTLAYHHGGVSLNTWFFVDGPHLPYKWMASSAANPTGPSVQGYALALSGAAATGLFTLLRARFTWFPFHPVGLVIAPTWISSEVWLDACAAWLVRRLLVHLGGRHAYDRVRPFFLGLIFGQFTCSAAWLIVDAISGARGNIIYWM